MKKTTFVALLLLLVTQCFAGTDLSSNIESEWAAIYYSMPRQQKESAYDILLNKTEELASRNPDSSELLYWQAVILASRAELQDGFSALKAIHKAKNLLEQVISTKPQTANGSAYVVLGTLYYMVPKWPIAFGDNDKAVSLFQEALRINPASIDANYFYGDFLLAQKKIKEAKAYFEKALAVPARKEQEFADNKLKNEVKQALQNIKNRKIDGVKNAFLSVFNSASLK